MMPNKANATTNAHCIWQCKRASAFLLIFLLVCTLVLPMALAQNQTAPVRILLTEHQSNQMTIGIFGSYAINDHISLQRGSQMQVMAIDNQVQLSYQGLVFRAGSSLQLIRHQVVADAENGLRFGNNVNLFGGDLHITQQDGKLRLILSIPVEEYLYGVVPYEMSDDFPLEALKAQSIAARTYTLRNLKPQQGYDLVDNTNDQVYRGLIKEKVNAIQAVKETAGKVLTYQGKLVHAFYTASNGGYTESSLNAWGREDIPYLTVQEDRFDTENPMSVTKKARISKMPGTGGSEGATRLFDLLNDMVSKRLSDMGYQAERNSFQIQQIVKITPHTTVHGGSLGVMKNLRFDLQVSAAAPIEKMDTDAEVSIENPGAIPVSEIKDQDRKWATPAPLKEPVSLDIPIFGLVEPMLGLSINIRENEIITVMEEENDFVIQFSRYGHGVGLSQRGAEWMAKTYNWNAEQILRFYYPGTLIETYNTNARPLPTLHQAYLTTPGPEPTATPRPTLMPLGELLQTADEDKNIVYVTGIAVNSSLNLRKEPNLIADVLMRLYYGQPLLVVEKLDDGWIMVKTDVAEGFVKEEFVSTKAPD